MGKKDLLANVLDRSGILGLIRPVQRSQIVIINYHRIQPDEGLSAVVFDDGVFGPSQDAFDQQVRWLRQNFEILAESDLLSLIRTPRFKGRYAAITFDDGYRDNYTLAYPVLKANSTPATYFICPDIIDSRRVGWWDVIAYLVKKTTRRSIVIGGNEMEVEGRKPEVIGRLLDQMKLRKASETAGLLEDISRACEVALPDAQLQSGQFMTWEEIQEVSENGIAIGSHTYTHRVLATLDEQSQREELRESKQALESRLGNVVRTLAYPAGGYAHFTPATMRIAGECGYEAAFSFHTGANYPASINRYNLKRIACTSHLDPMFTCGAHFPQVFAWFHRTPREYVHAPA